MMILDESEIANALINAGSVTRSWLMG